MTTSTAPAAPAASARPHRVRRADGTTPGWGLEHLALALLAFVPVFAARPGVVTSDTKTYLYLDPARFLSQVASMWYPTVALGTVTHQYVGYLFPMGPYYALTAAAHVPTWVAQRFWLGAILFAAGTGVLYLARTLGVRSGGRSVAALAYMLSPYLLQYSGRISVILLPWAGLPWMIAFAALALRLGGWRYPARFALVIALVSGINASSELYVVLGPCLWLVYAVAVEREATWRQAGAVLAKIALLSALVSAWWIVGLVVEAGYGVDILRYTESVPATSSTSTTSEVLRGLGYWYFYGSGRLGPWTRSVVLYTTWLWLVAVSFFLPVLAFCAGVLVRWRHRGYFVVLVVVGVVLSVGAYPYTHPTAVGGVLKAFMTDTTAGLAMRSTDRATPLVVLGLAMLLGAGVAAIGARSTWGGWAAGIAVTGLVVANNPAVFTGDAEVVNGLTQPASLPGYEVAAIDHLNATHHGTRVLAIPGNAFAAYTWGDTTDTPQPALLTRPFVTREQQVMGSMATADTLFAMDAPIQTATENWSALAPMARLLGAGDVLVEYDQQSALYGAPPATVLAQSLATTPKGLSSPHAFGTRGAGVAKPTLDPQVLAGSPRAPRPAPLETYTVRSPRPITRAESDRGALVVAGDATGLETLAAQGLLDTKSAIYYAGTLDSRHAQLSSLLRQGATLVVTDSNRKQGFRWNSLSGNTGYVEEASDDVAATTPSDSPIQLFPGAPQAAHTLGTFVGAVDVTASSYGNSVTYTPEDRPYAAIDGNLRTAWETGTFTPDVDGQWWQVRFSRSVDTGHIRLVQPLAGTRRRHITQVTLTFTGGGAHTVRLSSASRRRGGQLVTFPRRSFRTLRVTIDATSSQHGTPVGLAAVEVPSQRVVEVDQLPTDLLKAAGARSLGNRLVIAMTRARVSPYSGRSDPQTTLSRAFTLPTARTFALSGTATVSTLLSDSQIARLLGVPGSTGSGLVATSSGRLTGDLAGAYAAAGGSSYWQTPFGAKDTVGSWLQYDVPAPLTFDHMTLRVVADRRHSVPAQVKVTASTSGHTESRTARLPLVLRSLTPGTVVDVPLHFAALSGQSIRVTFTKVRKKRGTLAGGSRTEVLPLGIAGFGIPGLHVPATPAALPGRCQSNLLAVDGHPVTVRVVGSTSVALSGRTVSVQPCGAAESGLRLSAGHHVVETALATSSGATCASTRGCGGWNIDDLTLDSAPGGAAEREGGTLRAPVPGAAPAVAVTSQGPTSEHLSVRAASRAFELVLGESLNPGWHARALPAPGSRGGAAVTLGSPELVDAFANGWQVTAHDLRTLGAAGTGRFVVSLTWAPQREVWAGIVVSAGAIAGCLLLAFVPDRRRRGRPRARAEAHEMLAAGRSPVPGPWGIAAIALVTGAVAAAISQPWIGLPVAAAVAAGVAMRRRGRAIAGFAAVGLLLAAATLVVAGQVVHRAPGGGNWPAAYDNAAVLASMAVAFLGADAVVDYVRRRRGAQ